MTGKTGKASNQAAKIREKRLAEQLRSNLAKRKQQVRERAGKAESPGDTAPDATKSPQNR